MSARRAVTPKERQATIHGLRLVRANGPSLTRGQAAHIRRGIRLSAWRRLPWWRRLVARRPS